MAASPTDIRKGQVIIYQGQPYLVLEVMHRTPGNLRSFVQATMRNLVTGASTATKFRSSDTIESCHTETQRLEFSYADDEGFHFLNPETFEDTILSAKLIGDQKVYLVENSTYDILFVNEKPVQVQLPASVEIEVAEAAEAIRGDTVSGAQKPVTTVTGLVVQVPLFIKKGERIKVSTNDGSYLGRA